MSLELGLTSALNLLHITTFSYSDVNSALLSFFIVSLLALLPFLIVSIISAKPSTLSSRSYKLNYGSVY